MAKPKEAFLSHSNLDEKFATRLAETLQRHGVPVWYSPSHLVGSEQWHDEIGTALVRCDWFLIILSPNAAESMWVKRELLFALQQVRFNDKIVPILYKPCDVERLSWTLRSYQFVDFQRGFQEGCRDLLRVWGLEYEPEG